MLIEKQRELYALEQQIVKGLEDLRTMDGEEKKALRSALAEAKTVIAELKDANATLKKQKLTVWKAAKLVLVGISVGVLIGVVKN